MLGENISDEISDLTFFVKIPQTPCRGGQDLKFKICSVF
jgi:hypothetical protein